MAIQTHTLYQNEVLASEYNSLLLTKLNIRNFMTVDTSLTENAGMVKKINTYVYAGATEKLARGAKNQDSKRGKVTVSSKNYNVGVNQQVFDYTDEDQMIDPNVVTVGLRGMAEVTTNDFTTAYFTEAAKASLSQSYPSTGLNYDSVVDAIAQMQLESEEGLFLIISPAEKAGVRKDEEFKGARAGEILFNGQIGSIAGIPVVVSKAATAPVLATKEAVTLFVKKENEVEQDRDKEARVNTVIARTVNIVALTDATKIVKFTKAE